MRKRIGLILMLILGVGFRFAYRYTHLEENQRQQEKIVESSQAVNKDKEAEKYDDYVPVNGIYGLGTKDGQYYVVNKGMGKEALLENITNAYVLEYDDDTHGFLYGLFIQRDNAWYMIDGNAQVVAELPGLELTETTKLVRQAGVFSIGE